MGANLTLRTKLITAFIIVALGPMLLLALLNNWATSSALTEQAGQSLLTAASQTSADIDGFFRDNWVTVQAEAQLLSLVDYLSLPPSLRADSLEEREAFATLRALRRKGSEYISSYALLNPEGINVIDTFVPDIGIDESDHGYFEIPMEEGQPYISSVKFTPTGQAYLFFSSPVRDLAGHTIGVLRVRYNAGLLQEFVSQRTQTMGRDAFGILYDENGLYLAHGREPELVYSPIAPLDPARVTDLQNARRLPSTLQPPSSDGAPELAQKLEQAAEEPLFVAQEINSGDRENYVAASELEMQPWTVAFFQPRNAFLAPVRTQTQVTLLLAGLIAVAAAVAAVLIGQWLAHPLVQLTDTVKEFSAGNLYARAEIDSTDEVGMLAGTFNTMAAQVGQLLRELEERVETRTHELSTLLAVSRNVVSTLELRPLLDVILDQLKLVVDFDGASILSLEDETLSVVAYRGPIPDEQAYHIDFPLDQAGVNQEVILRQEPVIIPDVRSQTELARRFQQTAGEALHTTFGYIRSWMGIPLIVKNQIIGMISLDHSQANYYTPEQARLAQAFAVHVAVAIENARLYADSARRADEIQSLLAVQQAIAGPLEWSAVLQLIADEARRLTGSRLSAVYLLDGDEHPDSLHLSVLSQAQDSIESVEHLPVDLSVAGMALQTGEPILVSDAKSDPRVNPALRREMEVQSFLVVPLIRDKTSQATGVILVADKSSGALGADDERVLSILASGAVIQLENARLYEEEQTHRQEAERRRQVAEGLRDIMKVLNSDRPRDETLDYIVAQAIRLLGANAGVIYRIDPDREFIAIEGACDMPPEFEELEVLPWLSTRANEATRSGQVFAVSDLASRLGELPLDEISSHPLIKRWLEIISQNFQAYLSVPLVVKEEVYGDITLYYRQPHDFGEEEIGLAVSFADQAALSIENARLRDQVEQSAVAAERNRLARDLHDAVTQTLFSASLIAEVLPRLWERHPEEAQRRVQELRELNRGALAEMRTLLLELRPSALVEAEMSELMHQLADSITGRARVPVRVEIEGDCQLPPTLKVVFYRIAQEALNNVAKHAEATQARVHLRCTPPGDEQTERMVALRVCDDGRGFDPASIPPKSLGVGIMRERAQSIGAELDIRSQPGQGTEVQIVWQGQT